MIVVVFIISSIFYSFYLYESLIKIARIQKKRRDSLIIGTDGGGINPLDINNLVNVKINVPAKDEKVKPIMKGAAGGAGKGTKETSEKAEEKSSAVNDEEDNRSEGSKGSLTKGNSLKRISEATAKVATAVKNPGASLKKVGSAMKLTTQSSVKKLTTELKKKRPTGRRNTVFAVDTEDTIHLTVNNSSYAKTVGIWSFFLLMIYPNAVSAVFYKIVNIMSCYANDKGGGYQHMMKGNYYCNNNIIPNSIDLILFAVVFIFAVIGIPIYLITMLRR